MDDLDHRIVELLGQDARRTYGDVGERVSLSAPAVKRRVDRLLADGVLDGFTTVLGPAAPVWRTEAFVELYCPARTPPSSIAQALASHPEVVGAWTVSGDADALLHLRAADIGHLERALERIRTEAVVSRTRTQIVLSALLERSAPLLGSGTLGAPQRSGPPGGAAG